jgi:hypothetical protein
VVKPKLFLWGERASFFAAVDKKNTDTQYALKK